MQRSLSVPLAFAAAVAMWAVGYLGRFPGVGAPPALLGIVFLLGYLALGGVARGCGSSPGQAALAGSLASLINLLVLGSLLAEGSGPSLAVAIPGSLIAGGLLAWLGWKLKPETTGRLQCRGEALFAKVAVVATFLLVVAGGLVTSQGAGLAVPDWPNTFGSNMFFFPLSRMTGGIYYEHAHRLFGSLVGLTTVSLAVYLSLGKQSSNIKGFAWLLVVFVVVQGILGGLRVTGRFTISQDPELLSPSTALAVAHGTLGQLFLSGLVAQAVWLSAAWEKERESQHHLFWPRLLWLLLVIQLVLGALQRHLSWGLLVHVSLAVVVVAFAALGGGSLAFSAFASLRSLGRLLVVFASLQFLLGFLALWLRGYPAGPRAQSSWEVLLVTGHQAGGALLLALVTVITVWTWGRGVHR